ncbi:abcB4 [Symbiodinium microadriaticum]|nr:abcB4 [Symbiodinium microadriaticum]
MAAPIWAASILLLADAIRQNVDKELMAPWTVHRSSGSFSSAFLRGNRGGSESELDPERLAMYRRGPAIRQPDLSNLSAACRRQLGGHQRKLLTIVRTALSFMEPNAVYDTERMPIPAPKQTKEGTFSCETSTWDLFTWGEALGLVPSVRGLGLRRKHREALAEALSVSSSELEALRGSDVPVEAEKALERLASWFQPLANAPRDALLWAGFWDGEPTGRASKTALLKFADLMERQTLHPSTPLGSLISKWEDLNHCYDTSDGRDLTKNFWSFASLSFVAGLALVRQQGVLSLVNKDMRGPRNLGESVLAKHEIPSIGLAIIEADWAPHVVLVDLKGACNVTSSFLQSQLLPSRHFLVDLDSLDSIRLLKPFKRMRWTCVDCTESSGCSLDERLATFIQKELRSKPDGI